MHIVLPSWRCMPRFSFDAESVRFYPTSCRDVSLVVMRANNVFVSAPPAVSMAMKFFMPLSCTYYAGEGRAFKAFSLQLETLLVLSRGLPSVPLFAHRTSIAQQKQSTTNTTRYEPYRCYGCAQDCHPTPSNGAATNGRHVKTKSGRRRWTSRHVPQVRLGVFVGVGAVDLAVGSSGVCCEAHPLWRC